MVPSVPSSCVIGVDLGGTKLLAGAIEVSGHVRRREYRIAPVTEDPDAVLAFLATGIEQLVADATADGTAVSAVGIGIPSLVDQARGIAVSTVHQPLDGVPVRAILQERLQLPVTLDNDANCAMLAEWRIGGAVGSDDAVLLTIGTGIGSGVVASGRLLRGATGAATELGHMVVDLDGPPCQGNCRNRGCLEVLASGSALGREGARMAALHPGTELSRLVAAGEPIRGEHVLAAARRSDPGAMTALGRIGRILGVGIANAMNIFNPEVVLIGGGVSAAGELLVGPAREEARVRARPPACDARVEIARLGADAGMIGAGLLAWDALHGHGAEVEVPA
jgi:glucokinase